MELDLAFVARFWFLNLEVVIDNIVTQFEGNVSIVLCTHVKLWHDGCKSWHDPSGLELYIKLPSSCLE